MKSIIAKEWIPMNIRSPIAVFTLLSFISLTVWSDDVNFWQCHVEDIDAQIWTTEHTYQRTAMNKAYENCKKESKHPQSCRAAKTACEYFVNGVSDTPSWKCTALDRMSKIWVSNPYPHRDDAVLAARAYCMQRSGVPDSCYVNLLMCNSNNGD
jgi:hypothetical protein